MSPEEPISFDDAEVISEFGASPQDDVEVVEGLPVLPEVRPVASASPANLPAVQAAAAAATGFVAGAATVALMRLLGGRRLERGRANQRRGVEGLPIIGTRSFLVDVHLIAKPGE
jgi:hypothetical protein